MSPLALGQQAFFSPPNPWAQQQQMQQQMQGQTQMMSMPMQVPMQMQMQMPAQMQMQMQMQSTGIPAGYYNGMPSNISYTQQQYQYY